MTVLLAAICSGLPHNDAIIKNDEEPTFIGRIWNWIVDFTYGYSATLAKGVSLIVIGILISPFIPAITLPCIGAGSGLVISALVSKISNSYNIVPLNWLKEECVEFGEKFPKLPVIAFIITIFVGSLFGPAGLVLASMVAFVSGLGDETDEIKAQRRVSSSKLIRQPSSNTIVTLA